MHATPKCEVETGPVEKGKRGTDLYICLLE